LLAVGDPAPIPEGIEPLPYARAEAAAVATIYPDSPPPLLGGAATLAAVRAAWDGARTAHLACHGVFDPQYPLRSALILAGGERLVLGEVMAELSRGRGPRQVVLSACQTALTDFLRLPEEVIGFPSGLLQAGAHVVVGTLWPVSDWSTHLLMARFYEETRGGLRVAEALREAQVWLRSLSALKVAVFAEQAYRAAGLRENPALLQAWRHYRRRAENAPDDRPFAHPYYWAGFTCWGAEGEASLG